jgi:hypothetical protein
MATARRQILAWESRFFAPAGAAAFAATAVIIISNIIVSGLSNNGHEAAFLVSANEHAGKVLVYAAMQAIGFLLLMPPLYFLFRATGARSDRFRRQLVGVVIAAPIFFAIAAILTGVVTNAAADKYAKGEDRGTMTAQEATSECKSELSDKGKEDFEKEWSADERLKGENALAACERIEVEDDNAQHALSSSGLQGLGFGFGLAGRLGFAVAMLYTCLFAMRVGLLSRFWGSLGMALGGASLLLAPEFALIFFVYFGLLCFGKLPGGRPPAWAAGEAVPWPTPGEKMAAEMHPEDASGDVIDADEVTYEAEELPSGTDVEAPGDGETPPSNPSDSPNTPRKRKRRG